MYFSTFRGSIDFALFNNSGEKPKDSLGYDTFVLLRFKNILQMNTRLNNMIAYTLLFFGVINLCMTLVIVRVKK